MSAFAELLNEARDRLRELARCRVGLHFDWDGTTADDAWHAWHDPINLQGLPGNEARANPRSVIFTGASGEQALRRLVESLRA